MRTTHAIVATLVALFSSSWAGTSLGQAPAAPATSAERCVTERRAGVTVYVCGGREYRYVTENGYTSRVRVEERTAAQIEASRRERDSYEDSREHRRALARIEREAQDDAREHQRELARIEREAYRRFRDESFRYRGRWYAYEGSSAYDRSDGSYAARQQVFGACASRYASRYAACR